MATAFRPICTTVKKLPGWAAARDTVGVVHAFLGHHLKTDLARGGNGNLGAGKKGADHDQEQDQQQTGEYGSCCSYLIDLT
jgi:hypothetical protein